MSDEVYRAIAHADSGFVEAPAGCGKTEAIVKTVGTYCKDPQLILTHTHAGVDVLRQRFRKHAVPSSRFRVDTIAGWAWGWVRRYPDNSGYRGSLEFADWNEIYAAMTNLLQKPFVKQGILNSYSGIIVDEYQDCTIPMHVLIAQLKGLLPCRVLGDELQGIFGLGDEELISWADVQGEFANDLGALDTPHRWIEAGNRSLGDWLMRTRPYFRNSCEPDYRGSSIERRTVSYQYLGADLIELTHLKQGRICVIGPKQRPLHAGVETVLVNRGYKVLEPNELAELRKLLQGLASATPRGKSTAAVKFFKRVYGGVSPDDREFTAKLLKCESQRPRRADRKALVQAHSEGTTPELLLALLEYTEGLKGISCKLTESISALKCILEKHIESGPGLRSLYADEIAKRKFQSRSNVYRCTGSTLLVKGLEFDHAVILRSPNWQKNWGNYRDLYVALTRGSKTTTLIDLTG